VQVLVPLLQVLEGFDEELRLLHRTGSPVGGQRPGRIQVPGASMLLTSVLLLLTLPELPPELLGLPSQFAPAVLTLSGRVEPSASGIDQYFLRSLVCV
jgi:hypothetical protein